MYSVHVSFKDRASVGTDFQHFSNDAYCCGWLLLKLNVKLHYFGSDAEPLFGLTQGPAHSTMWLVTRQ